MSGTAPLTSGPKLMSIKDIEAYETKPLRQRYPRESTYDLILKSAKDFGQDAAIEYLVTAARGEESISVSFEQLAARVNQTANLLHTKGIRATDAVSILLPNLPETHYALWGAQAAGIASPINPMLDAKHIIEIMKETQAKALVAYGEDLDPKAWDKIKQIVTQVPSLQSLLLVTEQEPQKSEFDRDIEVINFCSAIAQQTSDHLLNKRVFKSTDIAAYFHTGGTTGRPKVAQLSHGNISFIAQLNADLTAHKGRFPALCALPLFHIFGTVIAGIGTFICGRTMVMMTADGFRSPNVIPNWWYFIDRFQVKAFSIVPTVLNALFEVPVGDSDISCLEDLGCGSAPLRNSLKLAFEKKFDVRITNGYGMTESTCLLARPVNEKATPPTGSVGNRLPYMEMQIAQVDGTRLVKKCAVDEVGEVLVKGPHVFAGYLNPADDAKAWVDDIWLNSGDVGYVDADGHLFLTGRAKDLIIRGGHNIDPVIIEEPLSQHPAVSAAVAIGQPDAYAGEIPVAFVTLKPNQSVSEAELIGHCQTSVSERAAVPKRIEIIDEIPTTAVGKVFKPALRNRATEFVVQKNLAAADIQATITAELDNKRGQVAKVRLHHADHQQAALDALSELPVVIELV